MRLVIVTVAIWLTAFSALCQTGKQGGIGPINGGGVNTGGGGVPAGNNGDVQIKNGTAFGAAPMNCSGGNCSIGTRVLSQTGDSILPSVFPESYGATGNGQVYFDGAVYGCCATNNGNVSTAVVAPATSTSAANSVVLSVFMLDGVAWSVAPSVGTQRFTQTTGAGLYSFTLNDQTVASAGTVTSASGTAASATDWDTARIILSPASTISYVSNAKTNQPGGTTITVTAPAGVANGDTLIACIGYYNNGGNSITGRPASFPLGNQLFLISNGNNGYLGCYFRTASSEPGSYVWTQNTADGMGAFVVAYRGANAPTASTSVLNSATAGFTSAMVGYPICVSGYASNTAQTCTTISAVGSSTQATLSTSTALNVSGLEFRFGADDTTAFQTMLTTAPCSTIGCSVGLSNKRYTMTGSLAFPINVPVSMVGVGAGVANTANAFLNGNTHPNSKGGSQLVWLTKSLSGAAIKVAGTSHTTSFNSVDLLAGFSVIAGAGYNRDGGGGDGISVINWQGLWLDRLYVVNFSGNGIVVDALTTNSYDYTQQVNISNCLISFNNGSGVNIGNSGQWIETTKLDSNTIEVNGLPGVIIGTALGASLINNTIQWNNLLGASSEVYVGGGVAGNGLYIQGNYIEVDTNMGSLSNAAFNSAASMIGITGLSNNFVLPTSAYTPPNFTASGLPAASGKAHLTANVSDAAACTNGTTLTGGGSIHCVVASNGTNWIETGAGWQ